MDCVENCGYNNLSHSRVVARVFSLKRTPQHMWVMWVYIVWVETWCITYDKLAKQNGSRVSRGKAFPTRHSENQLSPSVMTLCIPVICRAYGFTSREVFSRAIRENSFDLQFVLSLHTFSHT